MSRGGNQFEVTSRAAFCYLPGLWIANSERWFFAGVAERPQRIAEASRFVPLDRLAISPQCGFASTAEGNRLSPTDQREKLDVVAATARTVWPARVAV